MTVENVFENRVSKSRLSVGEHLAPQLINAESLRNIGRCFRYLHSTTRAMSIELAVRMQSLCNDSRKRFENRVSKSRLSVGEHLAPQLINAKSLRNIGRCFRYLHSTTRAMSIELAVRMQSLCNDSRKRFENRVSKSRLSVGEHLAPQLINAKSLRIIRRCFRYLLNDTCNEHRTSSEDAIVVQ